MMQRRTFMATIAGGVLTSRRVADAQARKVWRIGILWPYAVSDPISAQVVQTLGGAGYTEGRDSAIEWRSAEGQTGRFPALAADLVKLQPDAIMAVGDLAIRAGRQATATIPIIAGSDDLVGEGHVAGLARPGGNVTGVSILASELNAKRLEVLRSAVPTASRILVLWDPATGTFHLPALKAVATRLRVELAVQEIRRMEDLSRAFEAARAWRAEALNVLASPLLHSLRKHIVDHAARARLPTIYQWDETVRDGGLLSYGPTRAEVFRAMVVQLDRVLKGAKPADLPVEQPTKLELAINLRTARALGLTMPPSRLARADQIIE
jgi:putative ABC transport system substrate-binding protein